MPRGPLPARFHSDWQRTLYIAVACAGSIAVLGVCALLFHAPVVFPSLGPTVFILFYAPYSAQAAPKNVIVGQFIAGAMGLLSLAVVGLFGVAPDLTDFSWQRLVAVSIAMFGTVGLMVLFNTPHGPACATTLIFAVGLFNEPRDVALLMVAVVSVVILGFFINRAFGYKVPVWSPLPQDTVPAA